MSLTSPLAAKRIRARTTQEEARQSLTTPWQANEELLRVRNYVMFGLGVISFALLLVPDILWQSVVILVCIGMLGCMMVSAMVTMASNRINRLCGGMEARQILKEIHRGTLERASDGVREEVIELAKYQREAFYGHYQTKAGTTLYHAQKDVRTAIRVTLGLMLPPLIGLMYLSLSNFSAVNLLSNMANGVATLVYLFVSAYLIYGVRKVTQNTAWIMPYLQSNHPERQAQAVELIVPATDGHNKPWTLLITGDPTWLPADHINPK